jgi:hypothetical protein
MEGIYQMADGYRLVMVLSELLYKQVRVRLVEANLRKVSLSSVEIFLKVMTVWQNIVLN